MFKLSNIPLYTKIDEEEVMSKGSFAWIMAMRQKEILEIKAYWADLRVTTDCCKLTYHQPKIAKTCHHQRTEPRLVTTGPWGECAVHSVMTSGILLTNYLRLQYGAVEHQETGFHRCDGLTVQVRLPLV